VFDTTMQVSHAQADGWLCASRKSGGEGAGRGESDSPNIIEEPNRVIEVDKKRGRKSGGKKAGKGRTAGKGSRSGEKGAGKKRRG
jgi:hypothetical protein